ncbi:MAG: hypothetical protein ACMG6H_14570, partial [Acidobacteriota bacterium]
LLVSGTSGLRILWKAAGTGEKWAVVQVAGGGAEESAIVKLTAALPAGSGTPRTPGSLSDASYEVAEGTCTGTIYNYSTLEIPSGTYCGITPKIANKRYVWPAFC